MPSDFDSVMIGLTCCLPFVSGVMTVVGIGPIWLKVILAFAPSIGIAIRIKMEGSDSKEGTNDPVAMGILFSLYTIVMFPIGLSAGFVYNSTANYNK